jgi:hypothetical protein
MSITPLSPDASAKGKIKHGSLLNENLCLSRVNSQWKSTAVGAKVTTPAGVSLPGADKPVPRTDFCTPGKDGCAR